MTAAAVEVGYHLPAVTTTPLLPNPVTKATALFLLSVGNAEDKAFSVVLLLMYPSKPLASLCSRLPSCCLDSSGHRQNK